MWHVFFLLRNKCAHTHKGEDKKGSNTTYLCVMWYETMLEKQFVRLEIERKLPRIEQSLKHYFNYCDQTVI